ncbi:MAG: hypothetical protein [Myoviridae sp. ctThM1]|nr:MAG: hypothetical protein [Myoviridae sp. ctThM1]
MTFAIKWGDTTSDNDPYSGMLFFDAVTIYTQNYSGQVSKHPVDGGSPITDHFIKQNPVFTLSGVFSSDDISTNTGLISDGNGTFPYNTRIAPTPVSIQSTDKSILKKFIPDSLGQFLPDTTPEVTMDTARTDLTDQIRQALTNLLNGVKYNEKAAQFDSFIQLVELYEYTNQFLKRIIPRLVITNLVFREDANTGNALFCDITFEQVTFAYLKKTTIPKDVVSSLKSKSSEKQNKGKQDSTKKDVQAPPAGETGPNKDKMADVAAEL